MSYDVFVVAALEDRDMAKLVTRRLRSLKMRVWYDAKTTDDVFDAKEARAIDRSKSMLVLWSEHAVNSSFVRAAAGQGYSKIEQGYPFLQAGIDDTVPYAPYDSDTRHAFAGFTSRTNPEGWFEIVEKLETHQGRKDLKAWLLIPAKDKDAQDAWRTAHPSDPLAEKGQPVGVKATSTPAAKPKAAAKTTPKTQSSAETPKPQAAAAKPAAPPINGAPPLSSKPEPESAESESGSAIMWWMIAAIAALFVMAWAMRSGQMQSAALPGVANATFASCPPGTIPRNLLDSRILEPGAILNDTGN